MYSSGVRQAGDYQLNEAQPYADQIHQYTKKNAKLEFEHSFEISEKILVHEITAVYENKNFPVRALITGAVPLELVGLLHI